MTLEPMAHATKSKIAQRRLKHDYVGICKYRCLIVWLCRSDPGFSPLGLRLKETIMDDQTLKHFMAWLDSKVRPEEHLMVSDKIFALLADDPSLLDDHSWTQLRDMSDAW
jgi:hypothetical protein